MLCYLGSASFWCLRFGFCLTRTILHSLPLPPLKFHTQFNSQPLGVYQHPQNFLKVGLRTGKEVICCPEWAAALSAMDLGVGRCWGHWGEWPSLGHSSGHCTGPLRPLSLTLWFSRNFRHPQASGGPRYMESRLLSGTDNLLDSKKLLNVSSLKTKSNLLY